MSSTVNAAPFYGVDVDLHNVGVDVRVNDIPVYFDYTKGQLTVEVPTPESIIDGLNNLSLNIFLPYDEQSGDQTSEYENGAYATITLFEQDLSKNNSKRQLVSATLKLTEAGVIAQLDDHIKNEQTTPKVVLTEEKSASVEITTQIKSPFPKWAWQDGQQIENNKENFNSLLEVYKNIHSTLKAKDLGKLKSLYRVRAKEIAIAYGLSNEEEGQKKLSTGEDMQNVSLELNDLFLDGMTFEVSANGKLARIKNYLNAQPIFYYDPKSRLFHLYKFMFFLDKNNQWVMIR
ncbi:hypothetical protein [Aliikangiella coralliicola]|uniref:Uncharacterized protein n=1 Tax=Aliikangiella coralliicola TaxID=2592383 RepID=A0A545U8T7_9GAMM|nr:hypothetical protein [Aliikangiella coralliicola]TQV85882.1 hypothetical protein FLL46_18335 [Aliikangiella coralliicola]